MNVQKAYVDMTKKSPRPGKKGNGRLEKIQHRFFPLETVEERLTCPALAPGVSLGQRYTVATHLWTDSLGEVYRAYDSVRGEDVALGLRVLGPMSHEAPENPFQRVLALWGTVADRDHLFSVHDIHVIPYGGALLAGISMEYPGGGSFEEWLVCARPDLERRLTQGLLYFQDLCHGVNALHCAGIVHGNLNPASGMLARGRVKVAGWWESMLGGEAANAFHQSAPLRRAPEYMSPHRFLPRQTHPPDIQDDIYALGAILYGILHPEGRPPFNGTYDELRRLHAEAPVPPVPGVDGVIQSALARCLAKDPAQRFARVDDLLDAFFVNSAEIAPRAETGKTAASKADRLWQTAQKALSEGDFARALRLCVAVLELEPDHEDAPHMAEDLRARYAEAEEFYEMIERDIGTRDLASTTALLEEAIRIFPNHPAGRRVQMDALFRSETFKAQMASGAQALCEKQWDLAVQCFVEARELCRTSIEVAQALSTANSVRDHVRETRGLIDTATDSENWSKAQALARALDAYIGAAVERFQAALRKECAR